MDVINYINLASLAYINLPENKNDFTLGELVDDEIITADDIRKSELSAIADVNSQIRSWKLIAHQPNTPTGFAAAAFQSPEGQIIFAFRGTEPKPLSDPVKTVSDFLTDAQISIDGLSSNRAGQFPDTLAFIRSYLRKILVLGNTLAV